MFRTIGWGDGKSTVNTNGSASADRKNPNRFLDTDFPYGNRSRTQDLKYKVGVYCTYSGRMEAAGCVGK